MHLGTHSLARVSVLIFRSAIWFQSIMLSVASIYDKMSSIRWVHAPFIPIIYRNLHSLFDHFRYRLCIFTS